MSEWKTLSDIVERKICYGIVQPGNKGGNVPVIKVNNMIAGLNSIEDLETTTEEIASKYERTKLKGGELIISLVGTVGVTAIVPHTFAGCNLVRATGLIDIKDEILAKYVKYYLETKSAKEFLYGRLNTTVQPTLNVKTLENLPIPIIDRQKMIAIVSFLSTLDDKIAVNRRICENFEAQAQALFKHWFIDFAPFKEGRFVESELGLIPEGWRVVTLDQATSKFGTGLNPRKNFKLGCGNNYYVTIKNMIDNRVVLNNKCDFVDDDAIKVIQKRSKLTKGDLLFSGIGTIGRVAMVVDEPLNWNTSESVFNMHPAEGFSSEFLYVLLLSKQLQNYVKINSQGAVQQGIRMAALKAYKFPYPEYDIKEFNFLLKDIISKKNIIEKENDILSALRDTLLPKLMSGQIKL